MKKIIPLCCAVILSFATPEIGYTQDFDMDIGAKSPVDTQSIKNTLNMNTDTGVSKKNFLSKTRKGATFDTDNETQIRSTQRDNIETELTNTERTTIRNNVNDVRTTIEQSAGDTRRQINDTATNIRNNTDRVRHNTANTGRDISNTRTNETLKLKGTDGKSIRSTTRGKRTASETRK